MDGWMERRRKKKEGDLNGKVMTSELAYPSVLSHQNKFRSKKKDNKKRKKTNVFSTHFFLIRFLGC